jgi:hypothetical protein
VRVKEGKGWHFASCLFGCVFLCLVPWFTGCPTTPSFEKLTAADVVAEEDEVTQVFAQARANAPWSKVQFDVLDREETALKKHVRQAARSAGISDADVAAAVSASLAVKPK